MTLTVSQRPAHRPTIAPPPPPRKEVDNAVRQPALHPQKTDVPPPERYVQHEVQGGETLTEISRRYQTSVPMLEAANPQVANPDHLDIGQKVNVPLGADYGTEPLPEVAQPGQTPTHIAREHPGVSAQDIADANRASLPNPRCLAVGQQIWVPASLPATPLGQKVQATDQAVARLQSAQSGYDGLPADTNRAIRDELHQGLQTARGQLKNAVSAELDERAQHAISPEGVWTSDEDRYAAAGSDLTQRYTASEGETQLLQGALNGLATDREQTRVQAEADRVVTTAQAAGEPTAQLQHLNTALQAASPEVRAAAEGSQGYRDLLQGAADWAMEPLGEKGMGGTVPYGSMGERMEGEQAMGRLDELTQGLDPEMAARLVERSLPSLAQYGREYNARFGDSGVIGDQEMAAALRVLDRSADTATGQANMQKMLDMGMWNAPGAHQHISEGGRPDFVQAYGRRGATELDTANRVIETGLQDFRAQIEQDTKAYTEHMSELAWLVNNHGGAMTPEQLEQAIAKYTQDMEAKKPGWEAKGQELQARLAENGEKLLNQMAALGQTPPGGAIADANMRALEDVLNDPGAQLAIQTAFQQNPDLVNGPLGDGLLAFFSNPTVKGSAKFADLLRKTGQEFANAYVKSKVFSGIEGLDVGNPASVARARQALDELRNPRLAGILGVAPGQMDKAVDALDGAIPQAGESAEAMAERLKKLDQELDKIGAFDKTSSMGQLMRGIGLGLAGVGFLASTNKALTDPTVKNTLKAMSDAVGLGQKGADLLVALGKVDADSRLGTFGGKAAGRLLGVLGAGFDAWSAVDSFAAGDTESGLLYSTGAVGGLMALGSGPVGWIGLALVGASALGLFLWEGHKANSTHEPRWDDGRSMRFMQQAGLNEGVARTLADQSSEGHSPLPLLVEYARHKGLDLQQPGDQKKFADWINGLDEQQLTALKERANLTQDDIDGKLESFGAAHANDGDWTDERVAYTSHRDGYQNMKKNPTLSAVQLDKLLQTLGAPALS
ncbi:MAG: LysM domain-containing protein [Pseudomonadota bacterium]|nr:LysM domain-containing protein [Pseudomonadota bacterium]